MKNKPAEASTAPAPARTRATALGEVLDHLEKQRRPVHTEEVITRRREVILSAEVLRRVGDHLSRRGIRSGASLVEMRLRGDDLSGIAKEAGVELAEVHAIVDSIAGAMEPESLERLERAAAAPRPTGHIDWTDPDVKAEFERRGIKPVRALERREFDEVRLRDLLPYLVPKGPKKAVDLRPFLGDARNQIPRGTCAVFAAVAVAEAFEYFRDRRGGPVDLAEQFVWWYRGAGQRYSAGGYDCSMALNDIRDVGVCEEVNLPYQQVQINNNHTQVPIPDKAMDRAQFYRLGDVVGLPWEDVGAVKRVLESGRCVVCASNTDGWTSSTGEIHMPPDGTARGGGHCTAIVGYIDDDSLSPELEGGHFIIRNSYGGAGDVNHVLGPEYGGHLLMPYAWYRQYAGWPATTADRNEPAASNEWLVEYYDNRELRGAPVESSHVEIPLGPTTVNVDVPLPETVAAVDFNWGSHSPVQAVLPSGGSQDLLPRDNFSARFSKIIRFREGFHRFRLRGDDGLRLYVDDQLVINQWKDQASTEYTAVHHVTGGDHVVRIEYYESAGAADVHFGVEPIQWRYELFRSANLSGSPEATFNDTLTELEWRHAPPVQAAPGGTAGQFGLRGTASLDFEAGTYRFHAQHSGRFRLYVDGVLRHEDLDGTRPSSLPVALSAGTHQIRIELENTSTVPAPGSHAYYRAFCRFGWSDEGWRATFYSNARAKELSGPEVQEKYVDATYLFFRTSGLTGAARLRHDYPRDPVNDLALSFNKWDDFRSGVADWPADFELKFFGVWIRRRVFIPSSGYYNVEASAGEGLRVIVDGKEVAQNMEFIAHDPYNGDVYLEAGVHDISVEYNGTQWGGQLKLRVTPVEWQVNYYAGQRLEGVAAVTTTVGSPAEIADRAGELFRGTDFSATATRRIWLPVGRYHFAIKADDGVRLKVNQRTLIDAWVNQGPTDYSASYEHMGGWMDIRLEYYQAGGGRTLKVAMVGQDFYGEYYRGTTLNRLPPGAAHRRMAPVAYRYDSDINFDFGQGGYLPRVGATDFSARWMGKVSLPVGRWRIEATSHDGVRVYVDGRLLIDSWNEQGVTTHARRIDLTGRSHDIKVEYFNKSGGGLCRVQYARVI